MPLFAIGATIVATCALIARMKTTVARLALLTVPSLALAAMGACSGGETPSSSAASSGAVGGGGGVPGAGGGTSSSGASAGGSDGAGGGMPDAGDAGLPPLTWTVGGARGGDTPVLEHKSYDYAPSIIHDGVYRMWWCGGIAGDHILYAEATKLDGPWHSHGSEAVNSFDDVFQPTGGATDFDGQHTCDPSVVRVDGTYYLYYGGLSKTGSAPHITMIGVAQSSDGRSWTRLNGGKPILVPKRNDSTLPNTYGAGQPSALALGGKLYLIYTDTTGLGGNQVNGAGQYVLRSSDPTFQTGVEELGPNGFAPRTAATETAYSLVEAFSVDWQYVDAIDAFAIAIDGSSGFTKVRLFDQDLHAIAGKDILLKGVWADGPGIVSRPDKHAIPGDSCDVIPFDTFHGASPIPGGGPSTWDLTHDGADITVNRTCAEVPLQRVYEGSQIAATGLPLAVVVAGKRLQFALAAPAGRIARSQYAITPAMYQAIPFGASMKAGVEVLGAPGRPAAFHLDDQHLWPVSCLEMIDDNQSSITSTSVTAWDAIGQSATLRCLK